MIEQKRTGWLWWLWGGLFGVLVLSSVVFLLPFLMSEIFCSHSGPGPRNIGFLCADVPRFLLTLVFVFDFLGSLLCSGVCRGEENMARIFSVIPSFFLLGVAVTYIVRKVRRPVSKNYE